MKKATTKKKQSQSKIKLTDVSFEVSNERIIRARLLTNDGIEVEVYEPTLAQLNEIKKLISLNGTYQFTLEEVFDKLIGDFTNLDISEISKEVREQLMVTQPLWFNRLLIEIQSIITNIVTIQGLETKDLINKVNNMALYMDFIRTADPEAIEKMKSINMDEVAKALSNLSEDEIKEIKSMISNLSEMK